MTAQSGVGTRIPSFKAGLGTRRKRAGGTSQRTLGSAAGVLGSCSSAAVTACRAAPSPLSLTLLLRAGGRLGPVSSGAGSGSWWGARLDFSRCPCRREPGEGENPQTAGSPGGHGPASSPGCSRGTRGPERSCGLPGVTQQGWPVAPLPHLRAPGALTSVSSQSKPLPAPHRLACPCCSGSSCTVPAWQSRRPPSTWPSTSSSCWMPAPLPPATPRSSYRRSTRTARGGHLTGTWGDGGGAGSLPAWLSRAALAPRLSGRPSSGAERTQADTTLRSVAAAAGLVGFSLRCEAAEQAESPGGRPVWLWRVLLRTRMPREDGGGGRTDAAWPACPGCSLRAGRAPRVSSSPRCPGAWAGPHCWVIAWVPVLLMGEGVSPTLSKEAQAS